MNSQEKSRMRQKKASTTESAAQKSQRRAVWPYRLVSVLSVLLFIGLVCYMVYFQVVRSSDLLNSPYNKRTEALAEKVVRGSILSSDGTVLAETHLDGEGNENRSYPYGSLFAHTVGYLDYGSSGLEQSQNSRLLTSHADLGQQVTSELFEEKKPGDNVVTTLDLSLQQAARDLLGDYSGAVFVMDKESGDVLADVSTPSYDPNSIVENWSWLTSEENESSGIFVNRATQGLYPPGSTFKVVTALAYLRSVGSFDKFHYTCTGEYEQKGFTIHCAGGAAHGEETFEDAMANSCNCAFAYMATELIKRGKLIDAAESLGFNKAPSLEIPATASRFTLESSSPDQLTMQTGIGQGNTLATPMQMCMIMDAVANGGKMMQPNFVKRVENAGGSVVRTVSPKSAGQVMTSAEAKAIDETLHAVVERGTAAALSDLPYEVAGKTGTAQYGDVSLGKAHSWFAGYSNTGENDIVVAVLIENGGTNSQAPAWQAARRLFTTHFQ